MLEGLTDLKDGFRRRRRLANLVVGCGRLISRTLRKAAVGRRLLNGAESLILSCLHDAPFGRVEYVKYRFDRS